METRTGRHILSSGNIFRWEHMKLGGRGGLRGDFVRTPSDADIKEAKAFCQSQTPGGASWSGTITDGATARAALDSHVIGGSRN